MSPTTTTSWSPTDAGEDRWVAPEVGPGAGWIRHGTRTVSGVEIERCALALASRLRRRGWSPGQRVLVREEDPVRRLVVALAAIALDLCLVLDDGQGLGGDTPSFELPDPVPLHPGRDESAEAWLDPVAWEARPDAIACRRPQADGSLRTVLISGREMLMAARSVPRTLRGEVRGSVLALLPSNQPWGLAVLLGQWAHPQGTVVLDTLLPGPHLEDVEVSAVVADEAAIGTVAGAGQIAGLDQVWAWFGPDPDQDWPATPGGERAALVRRAAPLGRRAPTADPIWADVCRVLRAVHDDRATLDSVLQAFAPLGAEDVAHAGTLLGLFGEWAGRLDDAQTTKERS